MVANQPGHSGKRPFFPCLADEVTLACLIRKAGGDWIRDYVIIDGNLPIEALEFLARLHEDAGAALAGRAAQLRGLVAALRSDSPRFGPSDALEALLPALVRYLATDSARGWVFAANVAGKPLAWVPTRIDFVVGS